MTKVQVFITHYINEEAIEYNDMLMEQLYFMEKITDYDHETIVVYYSPDHSGEELVVRIRELNEDLDRRGKGPVKLIKNDRLPDSTFTAINKVIDLAEEGGYFVLLHNDVRVSKNWLNNLVIEISMMESRYGKGNVILSPRSIPYHYLQESVEKSEPRYPKVWEHMRNIRMSTHDMSTWCDKWKFPFKDGVVHSLEPGHVTDDAHILMMFISRKEFFLGGNIDGKDIEGIGYNDERYRAHGAYSDNDWGITALIKGKKNLKSQTCLMGHIERLSNYPGVHTAERSKLNMNIFIEKWGRNMWDEMQTGQLWTRLHKEQNSKEQKL